MPTTDFSQMLERGLGRAVLYAQQHDMSAYRDVILNGCLHCQSYDTQIEGSRAMFMWDVIHATPDVAFYRDQILAALAEFDVSAPADIPREKRNFTAEFDLQQLIELASYFARQDDSQARQIIYTKFDENPAYAEFVIGQYILNLDGAAGFKYIVEKARDLLVTADKYLPRSLFFDLEQRIGKQKSQKVLERLAANPANIPLIERIKEPYKRRPSQKSSYAEIKATLGQNDFPSHLYLQIWGKYANSVDLVEAAQDLLLETDLQRLKNYLRLFGWVAFPLDPTRLIEFTHHKDDQMMTLAFKALSYVQGETVRKFALDNIEQGRQKEWSTGLLSRNFVDGDWAFLEKLTATPSENDDDYHRLEMNVINIYGLHPSDQAVGTLLNLYEHDMCTYCRNSVVEWLYERNQLPDWMIEECRYDAYSETREFIEKTFGTPENPVSA